MVTIRESGKTAVIIIQPNRSASWDDNKRLLMVVALFTAVLAAGFVMIGAWMVVPFAGLELLALTAALYTVNGKLNRKQVIRIADSQLCIEKGRFQPSQRWMWPRSRAAVHVTLLPHHWDPLQISLCHGGEQIPVGDFLNREESELLLQALRTRGLPVRNYSGLDEIAC